jgi:hypothetical protein
MFKKALRWFDYFKQKTFKKIFWVYYWIRDHHIYQSYSTLNTNCVSKKAIDNSKSIHSLTFLIDSNLVITRKLVTDKLVYFCRCSEEIIGHDYVIKGFNKLMKYKKFQHRFEW